MQDYDKYAVIYNDGEQRLYKNDKSDAIKSNGRHDQHCTDNDKPAIISSDETQK